MNWSDIEIIGQCDIKHIMILLIITITSVLKFSTNIIISIGASLIGQVIMSASTFITAIILYVFGLTFTYVIVNVYLFCIIFVSIDIYFYTNNTIIYFFSFNKQIFYTAFLHQ